jgi:hypothetical protein
VTEEDRNEFFMAGIIKRLKGVPYQEGGEEHTGWLPAGAAKPLPTPVRHLVLNLEIEDLDGGYLLIGCSKDGSMVFDFWFDELEFALKSAKEWFSVETSQWEDAV